MGESLFKKLMKEIVGSIDDLFVTVLAAALVVFMAGQFYGVAYKGDEAFWYPAWAFVIILVLKLLKDSFFKKKKEKK